MFLEWKNSSIARSLLCSAIVLLFACSPKGATQTPQVHNDSVVHAFSAKGQGPAWSAEVEDQSLVMSVQTSGTPALNISDLSVERVAYAKGVEFRGKHDAQHLNLNIRSQACQLGDTNFEFTATLSIGDAEFKGCASRGESK